MFTLPTWKTAKELKVAIQDKPLDDITNEDLQALITSQVAEQRTLDYKQNLPGNSEGDKLELRADISSFANASGGHLIFGIEAKKGIPVNLLGVETDDADGQILRMEAIAREGIKPRIPGIATRAITLASGRVVIIMRIPRSWNGPHMATNQNNWGRFYSRSSAGKYMLDIGEIRSGFIRSETVAERTRAFRAERLAKLIVGETPQLLSKGAKIVLHLVPFVAFDAGVSFPVTAPQQRNNVFSSLYPIGMAQTTHQKVNFDGILKYNEDGYVQFFRNGCVESVSIELLNQSMESPIIPGRDYELSVIVALRAYLAFLKQVGVEPPITLMLSLLGVSGYVMGVDPSRRFQQNESPIDRNDLLVPEEIIDSYDRAAEDILKPSFDAIWNATGWERSMNYDEQGCWLSPYR